MNLNKAFLAYFIRWLIFAAIFNVLAFCLPQSYFQDLSMSTGFWPFLVINISFIVNLICAYYSFNSGNVGKFVFRIPIIKASNTGLALVLIVGCISMFTRGIGPIIGAVICALIVLFNIIAVIKAKTASDIVEDVEDKIKSSRAFISSMIAESKALASNTADKQIKAFTDKVYESFRYSDPISSEALAEDENAIADAFAAFKNAVASGNIDEVRNTSNTLVAQINIRNQKCKQLK